MMAIYYRVTLFWRYSYISIVVFYAFSQSNLYQFLSVICLFIIASYTEYMIHNTSIELKNKSINNQLLTSL